MKDLGGDIGAFKTLDIGLTAADALFTAFGSLETLANGLGHGGWIVGGDIETVGTAGFFKTAASTRDNGKTALDGFDNGNAKAFVTGGIDADFCHLKDGGEVVGGDVMKEFDTMADTETTGFLQHFVGIGGATAYDDELEVVGQKGQGLDGKGDILAGLNGADIDQIAGGELVAGVDFHEVVIAFALFEKGAAGLVDDADLVGRNLTELDDVTTGAFGNGDDQVGFFDCPVKLPSVDLAVEPFVVFGMTEEDEVVDGDDTGDTALTDAQGEFSGKAVVEGDVVALKVADDAAGAPERGRDPPQPSLLREGVLQIGTGGYLAAKVFTAFIGCIKTEGPIAGNGGGKVVDKGTTVVAESTGVADEAFGVISDNVFHGDKVSANEWKNQIYLSFPECSLTSRIEKT